MSQKAKALYQFDGENDAELALRPGDIVTILNCDDPNWWEAELNGRMGLIPANYVEVLPGPTPPKGPAPPAAPQARDPVGPKDVTVAISDKKDYKPESKSGPAGPSGRPDVPKGKASKTKIGLWASNMAICTAFSMIAMGLCTIAWGVDYQSRKDTDIFVSIYMILVGGLVWTFEYYFGAMRKPLVVPLRALLYWALSVFCFFAEHAIMLGVFLVTTGVLNFVACVILRESYDAPKRHAPAQTKQAQAKQTYASFFDWLYEYLRMIKEQNKVGVIVFISLYFAGNVVLFAVTVAEWYDKNNALPAPARLSAWGPYAKGFGAMLDLNCSLVVVPVLRTILRTLYNRSTADQGCVAKFLRFLLSFMPLDRNIAFHKLVAKVIVFAAVGHTVIHFFNYASRPDQTIAIFGVGPFVTGALICYTMLFIYSAVFDNVKRGQFEIFWYNHHFFIPFFIIQLCHGRGGWNPNFWKWFVGPGCLYVVERALRVYRSAQDCVILSVTYMKPSVLSLEFEKKGVWASPYKEGQYMFIQCPSISRIQWHPFTISSAPQEKTVTVHIKILDEGSWTNELAKKFAQMGPGQTFFRLDRHGPQGKEPGKILGPDGRPMLRVDAPHSAPTQHIGEYSVAMVIGAGIGVTPVAATLKSVVFHRWKYFIGDCYPDHGYFMWVCNYNDIDAFRWLIRILKDAQDEVVHMRHNNPENMRNKTFEVHVWVTSAPKDPKPLDFVAPSDDVSFWGMPREDATVEKSRASFSEQDIYRAMKCPARHTPLGDIHIWSGRPDWSVRFEAVAKAHPAGEVGVMFCGNPMIAKDLRHHCYAASHNRKGAFVLHKENF